MRGDPCVECKGTELKLIDGYYYCVECNTQNTNVRETVVEQKALGDGTFALSTRKKIVKLHDSHIEMSGEWYKWHAYNFIILGLADELVAAGAKPSFKLKLLWIWTRYIKKYQNKEELGLAKKSQEEGNNNLTLPSFIIEENSNSNTVRNEEEEEIEIRQTNKKKKCNNVIMDGSRRDIRFLSKGVILAMLYLALNLDESDIQLSHIYRFIKEKRLNFSNIQRFMPEDIHLKSIQDQWLRFIHSKVCKMHYVRSLAVSLLRKLDLGPPKVPNMRKIVNNILLELCLPNDIRPLVYSLMHFHHCDFLDVSNKTKEQLVQMPDYEVVAMSYVLVALKMCFGLDGDYEEKLSNAVEKINEDRDLPRSHRIGKYSEPSTRLFSFREWCSYMQFRQITLSKSCLFMAERYGFDIDDQVYIEHMSERPQNNRDLQDTTAMDLISRIPEDNEGRVIPKDQFLPSLTPMYDYTDIIIDHTQDQEIKFLLSEDFTQYSLKYACEYLELVDTNGENIIKGVSEDRKTVSKVILGTIVQKKSKSEMVYVKNCENRNWMLTNPPTMEHVTCEDEQNMSNDKESDHGYDSENPTSEKDISSISYTRNIFTKTDSTLQGFKEISDSDNPTKQREGPDVTENVSDDADESMKEVNDSDNHKKANEDLNLTENVIDDTDLNMNKIDDSRKAEDLNLTENIVDYTDHRMKKGDNSEKTEDTTQNKVDKSEKEYKREVIITEEDADKNIYDDLFEELNLKDEMEQNNDENLDVYNEEQPLHNNYTLNDDRASISDFSDIDSVLPPFNPDTFDREQTIKEIILLACKKYKISVPAEYSTKEPRKRKADTLGDKETPREPRKRVKTNPGGSKKKVAELINDYYSHQQSDFLFKVQAEVSSAIRNTQYDSVLNVTQNENIEQPSDVLSRRSSEVPGNLENEANINPQEQIDSNKEQNLDKTDEADEIDEKWEAKLFEGEEEMTLDDLIPNGDPRFDENKYDVNQLYIKMKREEVDFDFQDDKLQEILHQKIEECKNSTAFTKLNAENIADRVKTKYESDSDSEDDTPLNVLQENKKLIEEKITWEENFDYFINKENVSEFKYWCRHYDKDFMTRSIDWHKKFDEELKENTPGSFYFVIRECAAILNSSTFYIYKQMQNLETFMSARAKFPD